MQKKIFFNYTFLRKVYIIIFSFAVFTRVLMPIASHETQTVNSIVFAITAIFGASIIIFDFFNDKVFFKQKNMIFLYAFLGICILSSILNLKYGVFGNIRNIVWLAISFLLLYPVDFKRNKQDVISEIVLISNVLIVIWFFAVLISFIMFLFQIGYYVNVEPNSFARQGFIEERLFGIFEDPNFAAIISIILFILSIFNFKLCRKKLTKVFYIICMLMDYIYLVLSGSRTAIVTAAVAIFISVYLILRNKSLLKEGLKGRWLKELGAIFTGLLVSLALILSIGASQKVLSFGPSLIHNLDSSSLKDQVYFKPVNTQREDVSNTTDISNCRIKIWSAAIELFKSKPIFGTSPRNMRTYAKAEFPNNFIAIRSYAIHNAYIDIMVSTGIIGALVMLGFFIKYIIDMCKYIFKDGLKKNYNLVVMCISIVASVACSAMFLSEIFFVCTIGVLSFWTFMGYSFYFIEIENEDGGPENAK